MSSKLSGIRRHPLSAALAAAILLQGCGSGGESDELNLEGSTTQTSAAPGESSPADSGEALGVPEVSAQGDDLLDEVERQAAEDAAWATNAVLGFDVEEVANETDLIPLAEKAVATAPTRNDPRVAYWVDPRLTFSSHRPWGPVKQVSGRNAELANVSEPGIVGLGSDYALSRVQDPLNSGKKAFRHRISRDFPKWGGTWRSEISANWSTDGSNVIRGKEYWIAWAVKFNSDMLQSNSGEASILDFHVVPDSNDSNGTSPFHLFVNNGTMRIQSLSNPNRLTRSSESVNRRLWQESNPGSDKWHYFVMKAKFSWNKQVNPYLKIWKASGSGSLVKIIDHAGPNAYNDQATYLPQKFGLYRWDGWNGPSTRTMYSKGFYVLEARSGTPTLNEQSMLALLKGV